MGGRKPCLHVQRRVGEGGHLGLLILKLAIMIDIEQKILSENILMLFAFKVPTNRLCFLLHIYFLYGATKVQE